MGLESQLWIISCVFIANVNTQNCNLKISFCLRTLLPKQGESDGPLVMTVEQSKLIPTASF